MIHLNVHAIEVEKMNGEKYSLDTYKGSVLLIVNTASKCGLTPQFEGLEELHQEYKDKGLVVLGFPCNQFLHQDPGTNDEILSFCQVNYGVTFKMHDKVSVKGRNQHPLYKYLVHNAKERKGKSVKWNFEKFLIGKDGEIIKRFAPTVNPSELKPDIESALQ